MKTRIEFSKLVLLFPAAKVANIDIATNNTRHKSGRTGKQKERIFSNSSSNEIFLKKIACLRDVIDKIFTI